MITLSMLLFSAASGTDNVITSVLALVFALPVVFVLIVTLRYLGPSGNDGRAFPGLKKVS